METITLILERTSLFSLFFMYILCFLIILFSAIASPLLVLHYFLHKDKTIVLNSLRNLAPPFAGTFVFGFLLTYIHPSMGKFANFFVEYVLIHLLRDKNVLILLAMGYSFLSFLCLLKKSGKKI